jgi:hypothetical protein
MERYRKTLTPRQMAALHWANRDLNAASAKANLAVVETERDKGVEANQVAGVNEDGGGRSKGR